ncbi:MAG: hypothetical protein V8R85_00195 [Frisingicoccus sp.]
MEESVSGLNRTFRRSSMQLVHLKTQSPLTLAYIGDAAYELVIRSLAWENRNVWS